MFSLRIWRELASQKKPIRTPVLRDQKVLPEVRNRSLFNKGFGQLFELGNSSLIWSVNLQFHSFNIRYTHESKLQLEKFFELEVGEFWVTSRYTFRNLWFHHRGTNFGMLHTLMPTIQCRNSRTNPHPQPPYQASAWSYRYKKSIQPHFLVIRLRNGRQPS